MNIGVSYYVNPNTRGLTSNLKNTAIKDKTAFNQSMSQSLRSVENIAQSLRTPMKLAETSSLDKYRNSVNIALGANIKVPGGFSLTVKENGVEVNGITDLSNLEESQEAQDMAGALATLLRNAGGTRNEVGYSSAEKNTWNENVQKVLKYFGIDTSKDFTVNGMKYSKDENGWYESEAHAEAKAAYERMIANNRTYEFADERTRKQISYISNYYLENAPEGVKNAWQNTMEETGINPFQTGFQSTLTQLSMEQDFLTGGNDDLFGDTVESSLAAIDKILERIDNPLAAIDEDKAAFLQQEKEFYSALREKIGGE